jgi:aspartate 4-decarboxylase
VSLSSVEPLRRDVRTADPDCRQLVAADAPPEHCLLARGRIESPAARVLHEGNWKWPFLVADDEPRKLAFIDRIVADSRDVALNHTAGLSLPQQVMMTMFSLAELMDGKKAYQQACIAIVKKRVEATLEGLGIEVSPNEHFDYYYGLIDFEFFARKNVGEDAVEWMKANVHPLDIVFRLAEDHGIVLLNGSGFAAPDWSVRISFANLDDHVYDDIGRAMRAIARGYRQAYEAAMEAKGAPAVV